MSKRLNQNELACKMFIEEIEVARETGRSFTRESIEDLLDQRLFDLREKINEQLDIAFGKKSS
jgi:uncharacterized protein YaiI (UPF0178 family)